MIDSTRREYLIIRIMDNSMQRENGCREWIATKNSHGYGLIHFSIKKGDGYKSSLPAHRAHYMAHHNIILKRNEWVLHKCDNPSCVNIEHLFLGSPKDNNADMWAKGRGRSAETYKLHTRQRVHSDDKIRAIKQATGPLRDIAELYEVSISYVSKLRNGQAKTLI